MWHRKVIQDQDAAPFDMPALTADRLIGQGADRAEREAYERGFQAGEKAGIEMGIRKGTAVLEKIESLLREIANLRTNLARDLEAQCVELCVGIAKKIVLAELSVKPDAVVKAVKEALARIERSGKVTIRIHPALKDLFAKYKPELLSVHPDAAFEADPALPQYGAAVAGPSQEIATDVDEQLRNLIRSMAGRHGVD